MPPQELARSRERLTAYPEGFHIHPKIKKLLEQRAEMGNGKRPLDYGMAEALAFGSLVKAGMPVRLSGQDSRRGTFNQRHSVLVDIENEQEYVPLEHLAADQARCEIYNSTLSEAGGAGLRVRLQPRLSRKRWCCGKRSSATLPTCAQAVIDQFVSAGEDKWDLLSGVVLLLPHGYEGQGPEHSSARIERFLQLAARDNFQICQPSNAAQYFHLLRRQALRDWRKPLVVFTPKSMLRHPGRGVADRGSYAADNFLTVCAGHGRSATPNGFCCARGKIGHELRAERKKRRMTIRRRSCFVEQLYPFPKPNWRRSWSVIQTRATSFGCRKNRPTWALCCTCCPGCGSWPEKGRYAR